MEQAIPVTDKVHMVATYKLDWLTLPEPSLDSVIEFLLSKKGQIWSKNLWWQLALIKHVSLQSNKCWESRKNNKTKIELSEQILSSG